MSRGRDLVGGPVRVMLYSDSPETSGAEVVFADIAHSLATHAEARLTVAAARGSALLADLRAKLPEVPVLAVPPHPQRVVPAGVWNPRRGLAVRQLIEDQPQDAMILNLPGVEFGAAPIVWARQRAMAMLAVIHNHQPIAECAAGRPLAATRDRMIAPVLRRLDHAWVISPRGVSAMHRAWGIGPERCSVLRLQARKPERIDRDQARGQLGLERSETVIGIVGRVEIAQKGHDTFVSAAVRLSALRDDVTFAVVGDGPDAGRIRKVVADAGLTDRFRFFGALRPPDVAYSAFDAIAIPSRFEGLPLVALEALGAGLPGVASDVDGLGEVWPHEWTVQPDRPDLLATRLADVLALSAGDRAAAIVAAQDSAATLLTDDPAAEIFSTLRAAITRRASMVQARRAATR